MHLSPEQDRAVRREGQDVCVVAGPGSGKTRVLTARFQWLVLERDIAPHRILAITFTEKAALEIKRRLVAVFRSDEERRQSVERAYVSTIHGFCLRLLKEHAIQAALDSEFTLLDEALSTALLRESIEASLDEFAATRPADFRGLAEAFSGDWYEALENAYRTIRVTGGSPHELTSFPHATSTTALDRYLDLLRQVPDSLPPGVPLKYAPAVAELASFARCAERLLQAPPSPDAFDLLTRFKLKLTDFPPRTSLRDLAKELREDARKDVLRELTARYYAAEYRSLAWVLSRTGSIYSERKRSMNVLDFDDLEEFAISLLTTNPAVRREVQRRLSHILMDELQDTNPLQWKLVNLLRTPHTFFAVGDPNQAIYGFRHADPYVFHNYRKQIEESGLGVDILDGNYRSRTEILEMVDTLLSGTAGLGTSTYTPRAQFPPASTPPVEVIACSGARAAEAEALHVAQRIHQLTGSLPVWDERDVAFRPARFSDFAILVRTSASIDALKPALAAFHIPFLVTRGGAFFKRREVLDLLHWLKVVANPRDEISLLTTLRSPLAGVSGETLLRLKILANEHRSSLNVALELLANSRHAPAFAEWNMDDTARLALFQQHLAEARRLAGFVSPDRLLAGVVDHTGYLLTLDAEERANVRKLLSRLRQWQTEFPGSLAELTRHLDRIAESEVELEAPPEDSAAAVKLMTMHGAKGLEFPIVFCAGLHREPSYAVDDLCYLPAKGLAARWRNPASEDALSDPLHHEHAQNERERETQEGRRLLYVAMTRAQQHLVLSFAVAQRSRPWPQLIASRLQFEPAEANNAWLDWQPFGTGLRFRLLRTTEMPAPGTGVGAADEAPPAEEPVRYLAPPPPSSGQHSAVAVTSVVLFDQCPRQYYLREYLGWGDDGFRTPAVSTGQKGESAAGLGSQVHALLAGQSVPDAVPEALRLSTAFEASPLARRAAAALHMQREFDFLFELEGLLLTGQIDLWFEEREGLVIVDYKTGPLTAAEAARCAPNYHLQLQLYALALERLIGRTVREASLYFLQPEEIVPVPVAPLWLEMARGSVAALREAQQLGRFPVRAGEGCRRCEFRPDACPAWNRGYSPLDEQSGV
jgi:ATP-dependent helicase/nuclease subunit A